MIKKLVSSSAVLGIVSTAILSLGFGNIKAWALPTEEVLEKLNPVYVFTITNEQGAPLPLSRNDVDFVGIFMDPQKAKSVLDNDITNQNPELADQLQVVPVTLGEVYKFVQENQKQENPVSVAFVPQKDEVESAKTILSQNGQEYKSGVPLFVATLGEEKGYLMIEKESEQLIPMFFEKQQLETMLTQFKEQKPEFVDQVSIEVVPLEHMISRLQSEDNEILKKVVFVPSVDSLKVSWALKKQAEEQGGANQPEQK